MSTVRGAPLGGLGRGREVAHRIVFGEAPTARAPAGEVGVPRPETERPFIPDEIPAVGGVPGSEVPVPSDSRGATPGGDVGSPASAIRRR